MRPISERLRTHVEEHNCSGGTWHEVPEVCTEAADTIDALVAALDELLKIRSGRTVKAAKAAIALARGESEA